MLIISSIKDYDMRISLLFLNLKGTQCTSSWKVGTYDGRPGKVLGEQHILLLFRGRHFETLFLLLRSKMVLDFSFVA